MFSSSHMEQVVDLAKVQTQAFGHQSLPLIIALAYN